MADRPPSEREVPGRDWFQNPELVADPDSGCPQEPEAPESFPRQHKSRSVFHDWPEWDRVVYWCRYSARADRCRGLAAGKAGVPS